MDASPLAKSSASAWHCKASEIISHAATLHNEIATAAAKNVLKSL